MDFKGIAWVDNICQKFETMCLEVEQAMVKETAKFVENQVQTVGASMKRFCSDVMQDMLPPSSNDLKRVASADLSLNPYLEFGIHKKPILSVKEDVIDPVCVKGISEKKSNSSNDVWEDWSAASFNWEISDTDEANCDRIDVHASNEATICKSRGQQEGQICNFTSFVSPPPITTELTKSSAMARKKSRCISSSHIIRSEHTTDTCESSGVVSQMDLQATSDTSTSQSIEEKVPHADPCEYGSSFFRYETHSDVSANIQCGQPAGDEVLPSHTVDSNPDLEDEKESDTAMKMIEPIGCESESRFEETCVVVDGNDYRPDNHKQEIRRSYKKKIQNAFSLKKKASREQEYKQLAAHYGSIHDDDAIQLAFCHSKNVKSNKLANSIESEWELL